MDSGRGSVAYSSGRRPEASLHDTSADSDAVGATRVQPQPGTSQQGAGQSMGLDFFKKKTIKTICIYMRDDLYYSI